MDTKDWKELKSLISSLLISCPLQLTIGLLNKDFRNSVGENIPYQKFGFRTLEQCLDNMGDVLQRNGAFVTVCVNSKNAHIDKLVQRQMVPTSKRTKFGGPSTRHMRRQTISNITTEITSSNTFTKCNIPPLFPPSGILLSPPFEHITTSKSYKEPLRKNLTPNYTQKTSQDFRRHSTNEMAKPVPENNTQKPAKLDSTLNCVAPTSVVSVNKSNGETISKVQNDNYVVNSGVPLQVQQNLIELISQFDKGIWCAKLPETYQRLYKKELDYTTYGFKNLILMCMALEKIFYCYRPNKADFILYDRKKPLPDDFDAHFMQPSDFKIEPPVIDSVISSLPKPLYPINVLQLFDVIPKQFTSCDIQKNEFIDVFVAEIYNPQLFFVILLEFSTQLNQLMDNMQTFYSKHEAELLIPFHMIKQNLYCVTLYDNEYHRAKIIEILPPQTNSVKVFCFDYGSVDTVKSSKLCYLHKRFARLPQQAIETRLAAIRPGDLKEWTKEASLRLLDLTREKSLVAHVYNVERVRQRLDVFLADTNSIEDIYMNDLLVTEGHAVFKQQNIESPKPLSKSSDSDCSENADKPLRGKALLKALQQLHAKKH